MKNLIVAAAVLVFLFQLFPIYGRFNQAVIDSGRRAYVQLEAERTEDFFYRQGVKDGLDQDAARENAHSMAEMVLEKNCKY